jgi:hypothetical protein
MVLVQVSSSRPRSGPVRSGLTNINLAGTGDAVAGHEQLRSRLTNKTTRGSTAAALRKRLLVPRQKSFTIAELVLRAPQAALRYSLIKPWTTCLRLIRTVTSTG